MRQIEIDKSESKLRKCGVHSKLCSTVCISRAHTKCRRLQEECVCVTRPFSKQRSEMWNFKETRKAYINKHFVCIECTLKCQNLQIDFTCAYEKTHTEAACFLVPVHAHAHVHVRVGVLGTLQTIGDRS